MKIFILTMVCLSFLGACVSTGENDSKRFRVYDDYITSHNLISLDKIRTFKFQDWKSLDNKHLILSSSRHKQYLITLVNYCSDLEFTPRIALKQANSHSLSTSFDAVIVPNQAMQECRIKSIHELEKDQEKEVLALDNN